MINRSFLAAFIFLITNKVGYFPYFIEPNAFLAVYGRCSILILRRVRISKRGGLAMKNLHSRHTLIWAVLLGLGLFANTVSAKTFLRVENLYDPSIGCYRDSGCVVNVYADSRGNVFYEVDKRRYSAPRSYVYSRDPYAYSSNRYYYSDPYYSAIPIVLGIGIAASFLHHNSHRRHSYHRSGGHGRHGLSRGGHKRHAARGGSGGRHHGRH